FYSCITENCPEEAELCGYEISDSDDEIADTDTIDILSDQDTSDLNNEINNNKIAIFEMNEEEVYVEICENGKWIFLETCYDNACRNGKCLYYPDRKPNIYIYPPVETQVQVSIDFPEGGHVTVSEPEYYNGWNVTVTPEGIIDDEYTFLFYESVQPDLWQKNNGWVVETETLEDFFVTTLENYGFKGNEITDFIEWWVPRLVDFPYYIIYPQIATDIEILNVLNILPAPESILRFRFYISGSDSPFHKIDIPAQPEPFERNGFTVTEWGVILGSPVN
ncbi:MAG TPA: hypothetical protein PLG63_09955, partial [bacterium]|nr:hypothetical protein [bacterium]